MTTTETLTTEPDTTKCADPDCENMIGENDSMFYSDITGLMYCDGCWGYDMEHASTLFRFDDDLGGKATIGDLFITSECDLEEPDWMQDLHEGAWKGRKYVSTGGWSGHYDTEASLDKCKTLVTGWTTGWADSTTQRKVGFNEFIEQIQGGHITPPVPLYMLVEPLGNFSVSVVLLVLTEDVLVITEWLDDQGHSINDLTDRLG